MSSQSLARPERPLWPGLALLAIASLALFLAPDASSPGPIAPDASRLERLFPGVPAWWVMLRLVLVAAGSTWVASASCLPPGWSLPPAGEAPRVRPVFAAAAALWAGLHVAAAFAVERLPPLGQLLYVLALAGPPALLALGARSPRAAGGARDSMFAGSQAPLLLAGAVCLLWLALRLPAAWHAPRAAIPVDFWHSYRWLLDAVALDGNVLAASGQPGVPTTYMVFLGIHLLEAIRASPSLVWVQSWHAAWIVATALGIAILVAGTLRGGAAVVSVAVYLFSPAILALLFGPAPFGLLMAYTVALLVLLLGFHARGSPSILAGLGVVAGLAAPNAYLAHLSALAAGVVFLLLLARRPRPAWVFWTIPLLSFLAAALPALPDPGTVREMASRYMEPHGVWAALEAVAMGQLWTTDMDVLGLWYAGTPRLLDVPIGSMLSPFAIARTPMRMWGDSLFEPVGVVLGAVGLAVSLRHARRHAGSALLVAFFAASLLPGTLASAYDRASLTRNVALPLAYALAAAAGFDVLRRRLPRRVGELTAAVVAAGMSAVGGITLFDVVNPRILPASHLAIAVEAVGATPPAGGALLLEPGPDRIDWLHVETIGTHLPREPIPALPYAGPASLRALPAEVVLWSLGLEAASSVGRDLCREWRDAAVYELRDRAGVSRCFAARRSDSEWRPPLPALRWERVGCVPSG